jgi:hypothetical protein
VDPFSIDDAETLIAAIQQDWGEAQGNYDEFRFFTGLRPSEQIALLVSGCNLERGTIAVTKARVMARDKDRTKTSEDRIVALCPRAVAVLKRQLALRERWQRLGTRIDHENVFFKDDGEPIRHLHYGWKRWRRSLERLGLRPRAPYKARHSFITWNLMIGNNPLWVAKQHGHSAHLMLDVYANWMEGTDAADIARIEQAIQRSHAIWHQHGTSAQRRSQALRSTGKYVAERESKFDRLPPKSTLFQRGLLSRFQRADPLKQYGNRECHDCTSMVSAFQCFMAGRALGSCTGGESACQSESNQCRHGPSMR